AQPLADPDVVLRFRRQTLLRPAPNGFHVWSPALNAQVTLDPGSLRLLPLFSPPGQVVSKAIAGSPPDERRRDQHLATPSRPVSRARGGGVRVPTRLEGLVRPAEPAPAPVKAARKPKPRHSRDARGRIPVYCVNAEQPYERPDYLPLALGLMVAQAKHYKGG